MNTKEDIEEKLEIEKDINEKLNNTTIVLKTASQEIDWAIERSLPIKEYLELEDQPDNNTEKTIMEPTQKNIKKE